MCSLSHYGITAHRQVESGRSWTHGLCGQSPSAPAILVRVCAAAQSAKAPAEVERRSKGVVINKYTLSQSHHWNSSTIAQKKLLQGFKRVTPYLKMWHSGVCSLRHFKNKSWTAELRVGGEAVTRGINEVIWCILHKKAEYGRPVWRVQRRAWLFCSRLALFAPDSIKVNTVDSCAQWHCALAPALLQSEPPDLSTHLSCCLQTAVGI